MFLTNHTLTGLVLSRVIDDSLLLAPTALASHFAMDALPHFGLGDRVPFGSRPWILIAAIDNLIALSLFATVLLAQPQKRVQTIVGVFFACLPDLMFLIEIARKRVFKAAWRRFHSRIQHESPLGAVTELTWAAVMAFILPLLLK